MLPGTGRPGLVRQWARRLKGSHSIGQDAIAAQSPPPITLPARAVAMRRWGLVRAVPQKLDANWL